MCYVRRYSSEGSFWRPLSLQYSQSIMIRCPVLPARPSALSPVHIPPNHDTRRVSCGFARSLSTLMSSFVHRVAAGFLLLCPHAVSFVPSPSQQQQRSRTISHIPQSSVVATAAISATTATQASLSARATELAATDQGEGGGNGAGGGVGAGAKGKPPRSVLERPWDVEVDFHGERRVITVQPGDSILEAVS